MKAHEKGGEEADALLDSWALLFPPNISDETAAALSQFVTALASLVESRYGRQISLRRTRPSQAQKDPF